MEMREEKRAGLNLISGYGEGGFRIGSQVHKGDLLITPAEIYPWQVKSVKLIKKQSLKSIFESDFKPEFLLLGLGNKVIDGVILARKLEKTLGLPCEVMSTGAAVRTYNVLALEGRQVAGALIAI